GRWAREERDKEGGRHGQKDSRRWIEGYERIAEMAPGLPGTRLVYVGDRESDIVALMWRAFELAHPADWLIRSQHDRRLPDEDTATDDDESGDDNNSPDGNKLWARTTTGAALGEITFTMPARGKIKPRVVCQQLWARRVEISA
ncbi:hypothetical protein D0817_25275, partial [Flavobacterium cupreum]